MITTDQIGHFQIYNERYVTSLIRATPDPDEYWNLSGLYKSHIVYGNSFMDNLFDCD